LSLQEVGAEGSIFLVWIWRLRKDMEIWSWFDLFPEQQDASFDLSSNAGSLGCRKLQRFWIWYLGCWRSSGFHKIVALRILGIRGNTSRLGRSLCADFLWSKVLLPQDFMRKHKETQFGYDVSWKNWMQGAGSLKNVV
jgi:hypothetical protein